MMRRRTAIVRHRYRRPLESQHTTAPQPEQSAAAREIIISVIYLVKQRYIVVLLKCTNVVMSSK